MTSKSECSIFRIGMNYAIILRNMHAEFNPSDIKLIIALGNPGKEYEHAYHNAGFLFIDHLTKEARPFFPALAAPPQKSDVFMNDSGRYVGALMKRHGVVPEELLLAHDDTDLPLGTYKLLFARGSAGHKGVASVIGALGTNAFWRLRIGTRSPREKREAEAFVLKRMPLRARRTLESAFKSFTEQFEG